MYVCAYLLVCERMNGMPLPPPHSALTVLSHQPAGRVAMYVSSSYVSCIPSCEVVTVYILGPCVNIISLIAWLIVSQDCCDLIAWPTMLSTGGSPSVDISLLL